MKIIKKGTQETKKDQFYKGRCPSCNSEFVFEDKEITLYKFLNNNNDIIWIIVFIIEVIIVIFVII